MNEIVTYYLGAGASYNGFPTLSNLSSEIEKFLSQTSNQGGLFSEEKFKDLSTGKFDDTSLPSPATAFVEFRNNLQLLVDKGKTGLIADDLFKQLYSPYGNKEYYLLKSAYSAFFSYYQVKNKSYEHRYTKFLHENSSFDNLGYPTMNENVKVISWNYDMLFEKSYAEAFRLSDTYQSTAHMNLKNKGYYGGQKQDTGFAFFKLNGSALFTDRMWLYQFCSERDDEAKGILLYNTVYNYARVGHLNPVISNLLSFVWEQESIYDVESRIESRTIKSINETTTLVIVGYRFQPYNNEIDSKILKSMSKLSRIIIQDPHPEDVKERVMTILSNFPEKNIRCKENASQFHFVG